MLAYLRKGETFAQLAAGCGIGRTAAWRRVDGQDNIARRIKEALGDPGDAADPPSADTSNEERRPTG